MTFNAVVLAGSRGTADPVAAHAGVSDKALIEVGGRTMLARVVAALREAGAGRIAVSASSAAVANAARGLDVESIAAAAGPSQSTGDALALLGAPLLVTTADHALLQPGWITAFLADRDPAHDLSVLLARRDRIEAQVPETKRTYLRFADGDWSGCNLFHLATPAAARAIALWQQVEADRKRPWRIVSRLGPGMLISYALRRLTLADAVARLGGRVAIRAGIVAARDGLAAVDVDKPADLALVRRIVDQGGVRPA